MNRSELCFLYDISFANPNGDPLDENKPRIDEETEINIVSDVRLKRTIRDYLHDFKNQEIFVKEIEYEPDKIQDAKKRADDFCVDENDKKLTAADLKKLKLNKKDVIFDNVIKSCIDVRLFGATIPLDNSSITLTGPVQFKFGKSLNKVEIKYIKGTGAFASSKNKKQKTFREEYVLPYSLINFHGIINENAAKKTKLTNDDVNLLLEAIWNGTKNLITRSKFGQMPRLLFQIEYNENNFFIGDLDKKISLEHDLENDKKIRKIEEVYLNISELFNSIKDNSSYIESITFKIDDNITFKIEDETFKGKSELENKFDEIGINTYLFDF